MNRLRIALALVLAVAGLIAFAPTPAQARAGCVTRWEYNRVYAGDSPTRVRRLFDTGGFEKGRLVQFVYDGTGEYDEFGDKVGHQEGYIDEWGNWVDEVGGYVRQVDHVRSYKKCRNFDRGRGKGRVGVLFDTYSYGSNGAYAKHRRHPSYLMWWNFIEWGRTGGKGSLDRLK